MFLQALEILRRERFVEGRWSWEGGANSTWLRLVCHYCRGWCVILGKFFAEGPRQVRGTIIF